MLRGQLKWKNKDSAKSEWQTIEHALAYLARADKLPHRTEGEKVLLEQIPPNAKRVLDLGTGDGRLLALVKLNNPSVEGVALDFSDPMIEQAKKRFANDKHVTIVKHDFSLPLPAEQLGCFDAVVSSLAIHHLTHPRKKQLYTEIFNLLNPKGVFCNLEHVSSADREPTPKIFGSHRFYAADGGSFKQTLGCRNTTAVAEADWVCGCGLRLEVAGNCLVGWF